MASLAVSEDGIPFGVGEDLLKSRRKIVQPQEVWSQLTASRVFLFVCLTSQPPGTYTYGQTRELGPRGRTWGRASCDASPNTSRPLREPGRRSPVPAEGRARRAGEVPAPGAEGRGLQTTPDRWRPPVPPQPPCERVPAPPCQSGRTAHRLRAVHPSSPHPPQPPSFSASPWPVLRRAARAWSPAQLPRQHTSLPAARPTCRRGHFSMGPRLQLFREKMSFRFSRSRVPALQGSP